MQAKAGLIVNDVSHMKAAERRVWFAAPLVLLALAILLGLGTWQVKRLYWKEALLADIEERRSASPATIVDIEAMAKGGGDIEYRKVSLSGTFDHARERHFFATHHGQTGYYIYTPLMLADGRILFVNRGFVPFEMKEPAKRPDGQVSGTVAITGLARAPLVAKPSSLLPDNDIAKNIFYWKDLAAMASSADIPPDRLIHFFVDADNAANPGGWPQGGVTLIDLPNNHLQYAITWYGLAVALVIVAGFAYFRNGKAQGE